MIASVLDLLLISSFEIISCAFYLSWVSLSAGSVVSISGAECTETGISSCKAAICYVGADYVM